MQGVSADPKMAEPTPTNHGSSGNSQKTPLNNGTVEWFAQNMAEDIVQSFQSQMEMADALDFKHSQETMAKELASTVIEKALRKVYEGRQNTTSQADRQREQDFFDMDSCRDVQTSKNPIHPPLSQTGLPVLGSLDYPDAPPSTPLLPELERSRQSFTRKLKGGLANEFTPSPPPPTPKENQDDAGTFDPRRVEFMDHLMHSLSTHESAKDCTNVKCWYAEKMEMFAEALSCDILNCVREQITDKYALEMLANQLARTIINSSLEEAKTCV